MKKSVGKLIQEQSLLEGIKTQVDLSKLLNE